MTHYLATRCTAPPPLKRGQHDVQDTTEYLTADFAWSADVLHAHRFSSAEAARGAIEAIRYWYAVRLED